MPEACYMIQSGQLLLSGDKKSNYNARTKWRRTDRVLEGQVQTVWHCCNCHRSHRTDWWFGGQYNSMLINSSQLTNYKKLSPFSQAEQLVQNFSTFCVTRSSLPCSHQPDTTYDLQPCYPIYLTLCLILY